MLVSKWVTIALGSLFLVVVAGVVGQQHLYSMASMLITLPIVSYLIGMMMMRGLTFHRELPSRAWAGADV